MSNDFVVNGILLILTAAFLGCSTQTSGSPIPTTPPTPTLTVSPTSMLTLPPTAKTIPTLAGRPETGSVAQEIMPTRNHVPEGHEVGYNTTPPTSGDHWPRWAQCGFYPEGLPDELAVHNLEHGNVVVSYNFRTQNKAVQLQEAVSDVPDSEDWAVVRYYEDLDPDTVTLAAWGMLEIMTDVQPERIKVFFASYTGELGPEKIPC